MTVLENLPMEVKETYLNVKNDYGTVTPRFLGG